MNEHQEFHNCHHEKDFGQITERLDDVEQSVKSHWSALNGDSNSVLKNTADAAAKATNSLTVRVTELENGLNKVKNRMATVAIASMALGILITKIVEKLA